MASDCIRRGVKSRGQLGGAIFMAANHSSICPGRADKVWRTRMNRARAGAQSQNKKNLFATPEFGLHF
jgi:hypothetical protein